MLPTIACHTLFNKTIILANSDAADVQAAKPVSAKNERTPHCVNTARPSNRLKITRSLWELMPSESVAGSLCLQDARSAHTEPARLAIGKPLTSPLYSLVRIRAFTRSRHSSRFADSTYEISTHPYCRACQYFLACTCDKVLGSCKHF